MPTSSDSISGVQLEIIRRATGRFQKTYHSLIWMPPPLIKNSPSRRRLKFLKRAGDAVDVNYNIRRRWSIPDQRRALLWNDYFRSYKKHLFSTNGIVWDIAHKNWFSYSDCTLVIERKKLKKEKKRRRAQTHICLVYLKIFPYFYLYI